MDMNTDRFYDLFNGLVDKVKELREVFEQAEVNVEGYESIRDKARDASEFTYRIILRADLFIAESKISLFQHKVGNHISYSTDVKSRLSDIERCTNVAQLKYTMKDSLKYPGLQKSVEKSILSRIKKLESREEK